VKERVRFKGEKLEPKVKTRRHSGRGSDDNRSNALQPVVAEAMKKVAGHQCPSYAKSVTSGDLSFPTMVDERPRQRVGLPCSFPKRSLSRIGIDALGGHID